jgi:hypothetical protein
VAAPAIGILDLELKEKFGIAVSLVVMGEITRGREKRPFPTNPELILAARIWPFTVVRT